MLNVNIENAFEDNCLFILTCNETGETAAVDPSDANVIIEALDGKRLDKILITHHHSDHVGGVEKLVEKYSCEVIAFEGDKRRIPSVTKTVVAGDVIKIGHASASVMHVPGHTTGHIAYYFENDKALFCGDTLFVGGCGRLFEGTADMMFNSMVKLNLLPNDVAVYCAHEYTLGNLQFAYSIFSEDEGISKSLSSAQDTIKLGKRTVPSTIGAEKKHNVFLRAKDVVEFSKLRAMKDAY